MELDICGALKACCACGLIHEEGKDKTHFCLECGSEWADGMVMWITIPGLLDDPGYADYLASKISGIE